MIDVNGNDLTIEQLYRIAVQNEKIRLTESAVKQIIKCRNYVEKIISENRTVYGLTTGFGKFSNIRIPIEQIEELQENLILSHATGVGQNLPRSEVRAIMLLRINVLAKGFSGIRLSTLQVLIEMLNNGIHPQIPEQGSVGASGDLAPLAHLALVMIGKGSAEYKGKIYNGASVLEKAGIKAIKLKAKEGLALTNGTQVMTAITALSLIKAEKLCRVADITASLSIDALLATPDAFQSLIHNVRPYNGQKTSARNIYNLLENSELRNSHEFCDNVQDAYSLRCTPQVNGAVRDALSFIRNTISIEINAATDNPLIFPDEDKVISGGNFHGEPIAFAADILGFTVSELGNISDRRAEHLLNPALNRGLKPFLAPRPGLDSGYMIAQLTAAALISENKVIAHPASVDSIPTSANQEDHVSMGTIAAVKARKIVENTAYVLAIETLMAIQALDNREQISSPAIEEIRKKIRSHVPTLVRDREMKADIEKIKELVESDLLQETVKKYIDLE